MGRSEKLAGWRAYVDVLGAFESLARSPARTLEGPYGSACISPIEKLLAERVLIAKYPQDYPPAQDCTKKLIAAALREEVEVDWAEVQRLAGLNEYRNWPEVRALIHEEAQTLQIRSPYDSNE